MTLSERLTALAEGMFVCMRGCDQCKKKKDEARNIAASLVEIAKEMRENTERGATHKFPAGAGKVLKWADRLAPRSE